MRSWACRSRPDRVSGRGRDPPMPLSAPCAGERRSTGTPRARRGHDSLTPGADPENRRGPANRERGTGPESPRPAVLPRGARTPPRARLRLADRACATRLLRTAVRPQSGLQTPRALRRSAPGGPGRPGLRAARHRVPRPTRRRVPEPPGSPAIRPLRRRPAAWGIHGGIRRLADDRHRAGGVGAERDADRREREHRLGNRPGLPPTTRSEASAACSSRPRARGPSTARVSVSTLGCHCSTSLRACARTMSPPTRR